jgi:hypothetical protein
MPTHKSEDYKLSAVDYYLTEETSQLETCRILKCTPRSLMRWVQQYKKEGNIGNSGKDVSSLFLQDNDIKFLNCNKSGIYVNFLLTFSYDISISVTFLGNFLFIYASISKIIYYILYNKLFLN